MRRETPTTVLAWVYIERLALTNDTALQNPNVKIPDYSCVACSLQFEALKFKFVMGIVFFIVLDFSKGGRRNTRAKVQSKYVYYKWFSLIVYVAS